MNIDGAPVVSRSTSKMWKDNMVTGRGRGRNFQVIRQTLSDFHPTGVHKCNPSLTPSHTPSLSYFLPPSLLPTIISSLQPSLGHLLTPFLLPSPSVTSERIYNVCPTHTLFTGEYVLIHIIYSLHLWIWDSRHHICTTYTPNDLWFQIRAYIIHMIQGLGYIISTTHVSLCRYSS